MLVSFGGGREGRVSGVRIRLLAASVAALVASCSPSLPPVPDDFPPPPTSAIRAEVLRVTDGDTVVLDGLDVGSVHEWTGGRRVRLIGIDTPETYPEAECYGNEASQFLRAHIGGREVLVDFDLEETDRFGRALAYLWTTDGVFVNALLAYEGYATQLIVPPNMRYAALLGDAVRHARENDRGLWSACPDVD
jgi:micrococcal nuclease